MQYRPIIGLEIHAELKTRTKMFCACRNDPDEAQPNINVCPICLAHPGALPTINQEAVRQVLRLGLAVGGELARWTEFDRKNYFYPDLPKGYQISQYERPLVRGGELVGVKITRVHLEEDTARAIHDEKTGESLIDFNRAGVPLMELVTEPVITTGRQAADFAKELQLVLRYLKAGEANLEKGEMRVEANISLGLSSTAPKPQLGVKVEVKNLNSFRSVRQAIDYELRRQEKILASGGQINQETRGWDETKGVTFSQREKESSHDYRYFPDPDLPPLDLAEIDEFKNLAATIPELPEAKRLRYRRDYGIKNEDIEVLLQNTPLRTLFEVFTVPKLHNAEQIKLASNYLTNDLVSLAGENESKIANIRETFAELIKMIADGAVSSRGAKDILAAMIETGEKPQKIAETQGLLQQSDEKTLQEIIDRVIAANPTAVADYQAGKETALQYLVGQGMKESRGTANPETLVKLLKKSIQSIQ